MAYAWKRSVRRQRLPFGLAFVDRQGPNEPGVVIASCKLTLSEEVDLWLAGRVGNESEGRSPTLSRCPFVRHRRWKRERGGSFHYGHRRGAHRHRCDDRSI